MTHQGRLTGLIPAVFSPMHEDGSLNLDIVPILVDHLLAQGASALYINGSTGEGASLTVEERKMMARTYVDAVADRVPTIIQVGHNSLAEARGLAAHADSIGADAISAVPPSYFRPRDLETLIDCLAEITASTQDLPFYYYHIPSVTGVDFDMVELLRLGSQRLPSLVGIKYSKTTVFEMQSCVNLEQGRFNVLFGSDEMLLSGLVGGAHGAVGSTYNYAMPLYQTILKAYRAGDMAEAQRLQGLAAEFIRPIFRFGGNPALKAMMNIIGLDCGPTRLPQRTLTPDQVHALRQAMVTLGFFQWVEGLRS